MATRLKSPHQLGSNTSFTIWRLTKSAGLSSVVHLASSVMRFITCTEPNCSTHRVCAGGSAAMHLRGATSLSNRIEMIAFLTKPATIEIEIAGRKTRKAAPAGLALASTPARSGRPTFRVNRDGRTVVEKQSDWQIQSEEDRVDPLYVGGSTTRPFAPSN